MDHPTDRGASAPQNPGRRDPAAGPSARPNPGTVRTDDFEPYLALAYVARLFKIAAGVVAVALVAEVVAGLALEGAAALIPLIGELTQGVVLAAMLWGAGDITVLMIDIGHDVRAARVLLGRLSARSERSDPVREEAERRLRIR